MKLVQEIQKRVCLINCLFQAFSMFYLFKEKLIFLLNQHKKRTTQINK